MNSLAKWVWFILLCILFVGEYIIYYIIVGVVAFVLIAWLKPEWLDKL